jgi:hypothetical protein
MLVSALVYLAGSGSPAGAGSARTRARPPVARAEREDGAAGAASAAVPAAPSARPARYAALGVASALALRPPAASGAAAVSW